MNQPADTGPFVSYLTDRLVHYRNSEPEEENGIERGWLDLSGWSNTSRVERNRGSLSD